MALLKDSLIAHYKMNDNLATDVIIDETGDHNGVVNDAGGTATSAFHSVAGKINRAQEFDGIDDFINCVDPFQSTFRGSFSVSVWAKLNDGQPTVTESLLGVRDGTGNDSAIHFSITSVGKVEFYYESEGNSGNRATTGVILSDGAQDWIHFVATANSTIGGVGGKKIYVNGVEQTLSTDGSTAGVTFADFTSAINLAIGAYQNHATAVNFIDGALDNVMFFNKELTPLEVNLLYNAGAGVEDIPIGIHLSRTGQQFASSQMN
jgi:hypothetical protein